MLTRQPLVAFGQIPRRSGVAVAGLSKAPQRETNSLLLLLFLDVEVFVRLLPFRKCISLGGSAGTASAGASRTLDHCAGGRGERGERSGPGARESSPDDSGNHDGSIGCCR